jgi:hypothetical protein
MHQDSSKPSPSPTLPRKRGRERTESAALSADHPPVAHRIPSHDVKQP